MTGVTAMIAGAVNRLPRVTVRQIFATNTTQTTLDVSILSGYSLGLSDVVITVNNNIDLYSTDNSSAALTITGSNPGDRIILINNGTIYGGGGAGGRNNQGGYFEESGNTDGPGQGGDVPSNAYGNSGGYPPQNGSDGQSGGAAIHLLTNEPVSIYNNNGLIYGGGGGAGGGGSNNGVGGSGGSGGIAVTKGASNTPTVTLYNQNGGEIAGGGGGGPGWGNRVEGSSSGGFPGSNATYSGPGNFGANGQAGTIATGSLIKVINDNITVILY